LQQWRNILTGCLGLADTLGTAVTFSLQRLGFYLDGLAPVFQRLQDIGVEREAAAGKLLFDRIEFIA
jgi:hypothetical protein